MTGRASQSTSQPDLRDIIRQVKSEPPPRHPGGRPSLLTPELTERMATMLESGVSRRATCRAHGITYQTFLNWLHRAEDGQPEFFEFFDHITRAEGMAEARMTLRVTDAAKNDWRAALEWLKRMRRDEWGDSLDISKLSNERLIELLDATDPEDDI